MRLHCTIQVSPVIWRIGEMLSVIINKHSAQNPVDRSINSIGFAPNCSFIVSQDSLINGTKHSKKTQYLNQRNCDVLIFDETERLLSVSALMICIF